MIPRLPALAAAVGFGVAAFSVAVAQTRVAAAAEAKLAAVQALDRVKAQANEIGEHRVSASTVATSPPDLNQIVTLRDDAMRAAAIPAASLVTFNISEPRAVTPRAGGPSTASTLMSVRSTARLAGLSPATIGIFLEALERAPSSWRLTRIELTHTTDRGTINTFNVTLELESRYVSTP